MYVQYDTNMNSSICSVSHFSTKFKFTSVRHSTKKYKNIMNIDSMNASV